MTQTAVTRIQRMLKGKYFKDGCTVYMTEAGLLIAGTKDGVSYEEAAPEVISLVSSELQVLNTLIYHLFVYGAGDSQFKSEATLYTKAPDFNRGMYTTHRTSSDADVFLREIDFLYLSLIDNPTEKIEVENNPPGAPLTEGFRYAELMVMGEGFGPATAMKREEKWYLTF